MAILDKIRKQTTILILIIGLALFAFVISGIFSADAFSGNKVGSAVAEVNGTDISIDAFREKVDIATRNFGPNATAMQVVNNVYEQEVRNAILDEQFEALGITVEQDQIVDFLRSNPQFSQLPQFLNENGLFDETKFINYIQELKDSNPAAYQAWLQNEKDIIRAAKEQIYFNLIGSGIGATLKEGELDYKFATDKLDIKYVRVPYTSIADSTVQVSKAEIEDYIKAHKEDFKQEKSRDIQFVYFEEKASVKDENTVKENVASLLRDKEVFSQAKDTTEIVKGFRNTEDMEVFLDLNSDAKYDTIYKPKSSFPAKFADTIANLQIGEVFGPYRDGNAFKVTKMMGKKSDGNVKASHILIKYKDSQSSDETTTRTKAEAESLAKEILEEAKRPDTDFAELAKEKSEGPTAPRGGDLGFFQEGRMVPAFNDFVFGNSVGTIGIAETEFGFHVIKVDEKQDIYQVANLVRAIEASEETIDLLFQNATKFEMQSIEGTKDFADLATENGYVARPVNKLNAMDENLPGLAAQRSIVQWAFNEETKIGDVKRFDLNNGYAVVQLTGQYAKGLMAVEDASATVLPILRKKKKAAQIMNANKGKSMEDFASGNTVSVSNASALTVKSPTIPGAGNEPAVVGTAYVLGEGKTSGLIEGNTGIFMLTVTKKTDAPKLDNYSTFANTLKNARANTVSSSLYQALKDKSEIEDNRAMFY